MNISERGLNLIKSFEGCRLSSYKCPSNKWTIGYGHTQGVCEGMVITQEQADKFLFEDVQRFVNAVNQYQSRFNFNQAELDSLTSFAYNCGEGSLQAVMSCCNTKQEIAEECKLYNKSSDGQVLAGLVRRREEEYKLFMSGAYSSNNTTVAANNTYSSYHENGEFFFNTKVRIRTAPSLDASTIATDIQEPFYNPGESVVYHTVHLNQEGYNWIQYNRTSDGQVLAGLVRRREEEYKLFMSGANNNDGYSYAEKGEYFFNTRVKIRTAPNLDDASFTRICYDAGESVEYHTVHRNKCGYNWIQYNRGNGTQGYCAITDLATGERFGHAI